MVEVNKSLKMTEEATASKGSTGGRIALKDWNLAQNDVSISIKKGDNVDELGVPKHLIAALITENVIKK